MDLKTALQDSGALDLLHMSQQGTTVTADDLMGDLAGDTGTDTPTGNDVVANQPEDVNQHMDRGALLRQIRKFGENEAAGANARPSMAVQVVEAARAGAIVEDDAPHILEQYLKGVAAKRGVSSVSLGSEPQQLSKLKTFIKLGQIATCDGRKTVAKVADAVRKIRDEAGGKGTGKSPYDCMLSAARMQLSFPDELLSDEQIMRCCMPSPKTEKLEADLLDAIAAAADRLRTNDATPVSEESEAVLQEVVEKVMDRVKALGGSTRQKKIEEKLQKEIAKAQAKLNHLVSRY